MKNKGASNIVNKFDKSIRQKYPNYLNDNDGQLSAIADVKNDSDDDDDDDYNNNIQEKKQKPKQINDKKLSSTSLAI